MDWTWSLNFKLFCTLLIYPAVDQAIQAEFYRLFLSHDNATKDSVRNEPLPPGISQNDLDFITSVCPKNAFFYSSSPMHVQAIALLQQYLAGT